MAIEGGGVVVPSHDPMMENTGELESAATSVTPISNSDDQFVPCDLGFLATAQEELTLAGTLISSCVASPHN
ncbi:hypothetical protein GUJ93_ZPchr0062g7134 [Zizania palustris]|uniref:Uncharacterized protein n=1 Tax=Zizania palustris TaxID=103762 RepID=A0A8J5REH1_ZIZPA|nr:hypothetical protein GUJ93_ZPchr0062g7134 [Zizania palustris]